MPGSGAVEKRAENGYVSPTFFAWALAGTGATDEALDQVEKVTPT